MRLTEFVATQGEQAEAATRWMHWNNPRVLGAALGHWIVGIFGKGPTLIIKYLLHLDFENMEEQSGKPQS